MLLDCQTTQPPPVQRVSRMGWVLAVRKTPPLDCLRAGMECETRPTCLRRQFQFRLKWQAYKQAQLER